MLLLGATFSLILILLFPEHYLSRTDMNSLANWAQDWNENWADIYVTCEECNYPFVGAFLYAGIASILGIVDDFQRGAFNYRIFLAVIDGFNIRSRNDLIGNAFRIDGSPLQHHHSITILSRQIDIM